MALELFKPHMFRALIERGYTQTPRSARTMIENCESIVNISTIGPDSGDLPVAINEPEEEQILYGRKRTWKCAGKINV